MKKTSFSGRHITIFLFAAALLMTIISCKEKDKDIVKPKTITDIILENNDFTILRELIQKTSMTDALRTQNVTMFAPNDAAFRSSNIANASVIISKGEDSARSFVNNHIIKGMMLYSELQVKDYKALNDSTISIKKVSTTDTTLLINRAYVLLKNLNADNGVIHVVDRTLTNK